MAYNGVYQPVQRMLTELGTERRCNRCGEWWPEDQEFWFYDAKGRVLGHCKACWSERERPRRDGTARTGRASSSAMGGAA